METESHATRSRRTGRLPLAIAITVVAILGIAYYFYVRDQRDYFSSRNLRLLATVTKQLDEALRSNEGFVRNYGASRVTPTSYTRAGGSNETKLTAADPAIFLPRFESASRKCDPAGNEPAGPPSFGRTLTWPGAQPLVTITYREVAAPLPRIYAPNMDRAKPLPPLNPSQSSDPCLAPGLIAHSAIATIPLQSILEPIFSQSLLSAFDDVMLVRGDGSVLFTEHQHARGALSSSGEEESLPEQIVTDISALVESAGWRGQTQALELAKVRAATRISEVQTSSGTYYLFTQPFGHATVARDSATPKDERPQWIVAGMVSKRRFMYEVLAVSASSVLVILAVLLMMICTWPYLRIALIGAHQRITIADVLLLGFAALIHASILTLVVCDVLAYRSLRGVSDQQLAIFADRLERDLYDNLYTATQTLRALDEWALDPLATDRWASSDLEIFQAHDQRVIQLELPNPYVSSVAWIDAAGRQRFKATMGEGVPLVDVAHRAYFQNAKAGRLYQIDKDAENAFAVESIRSSVTGKTEAVIARPTRADDLEVVAATVALVDVTHAVTPPGFGFAIIDDAGKVVFHSEESRNNQENFFAETDWNRTVRSAVFARVPGKTSVRYWGADHRVFVKPLPSLPWTLIAFRNKSLLRTVNTEAVAMTLSMLMGNAAIYLVAIFLLLLGNPRYRAPHAWPVESNAMLYARLIVLYAVMIVSASLTVYAFDPLSVLIITMLVPAQAFAATLLILERRRGSRRWIAAATLWGLFTAIWIFVLLRSETLPGTAVHDSLGLIRIVALALLGASAWATFTRRDAPFVPKHYSLTYLAAGVLLLIVVAVVPTFGFFKVSSRLEIEGLVKYSQLTIADRIEQAIVGAEEANMTGGPGGSYCATWDHDPFQTSWMVVPPVGDCVSQLGEFSPGAGSRRDRAWLPEIYRDVLPAYSEESVSLRQLHGSAASDSLWEWWWKNDQITLVKRIASPQTAGGEALAPSIRVRSRVPLSFAEAWSTEFGWTSEEAVRVIVFVLAVAAVIVILFAIVRFFAVRLFLIDLREPLWLAPRKPAPPPLTPTLGDHVLLLRRTLSVEALTTSRDAKQKNAPKHEFIDVKFKELDDDAKPAAWEEKLLEIDRAAEGKNVRVFDFEHRATDAGLSMRKLTFLERLLALPNRTVIVASTISPAAFLALMTNAELRKRWTAVLDAFVWVTESQLELASDDDENAPQTRDTREWLHHETAQGAFLRDLRDELEPIAASADREQLIDEIRERSNTYYGGLWASCSAAEKILLHQLAREGLMNGKDRRSVRRLLARGLVRRRPNLRIFNETFRRYVLAAAKREQVPVDAHEGMSAWDAIRLPLFVVIVAVLIMIFATQKDMLNLATGLAAALTTGVPAIVRLFGFFTERRITAAEKT